MQDEAVANRGHCYTVTVMLELGGERVLLCEPDGPLFDDEQRATDLVGDALSMHATLIAVPVSRLDPAFFDLCSGVAGMFAQKVVIYHFKLAVVGDVADHLAASGALRDWVRECNRGGTILFVPSFDDLVARRGNSTVASRPTGGVTEVGDDGEAMDGRR